VLTLSVLLYLKISTGAAAGNSLNSTLIDNPKVLSCYLAGCIALSTVGFVEFVSHMFAYMSGMNQALSFEQRDRGTVISIAAMVPIIALVFASEGFMTALPITYSFNNSILCCGHSYYLFNILGITYPSIFKKSRTLILSVSVYLAMISFMIGFGKDLMYWSNTLSVVMLIAAFIFPTSYLLWKVVLAYDYLNRKWSSYAPEEVYAMCLVCLYLIGKKWDSSD